MHGRIVEPTKEVDVLAHKVIGAAIEVHRTLGAGYLESIYEAALTYELQQQCIEYKRQFVMPIVYKNQEIGLHRFDFLIDKQLVVELKSVAEILPVHRAQVISYLKAINKQVGLLINFNVAVLRDGGIKRVVYSH